MLFAASLLLPLLLLSFWLYWRLSPTPDRRPLRWFNLGVTALCLALAAAVAVGVRAAMAASTDHAWWPVVAAFYAALAVPLFLALGGTIRRHIFGIRVPAKSLELTRDLSNTRF